MKPVRERLCKAISERLHQLGFVIPWEAIIVIVEWFLSECFNIEEAFVSAARNPSWFQCWLLYRKTLRVLRSRERLYGRELRKAANATTDAILEAGMTASEADLIAAFKE